MYIKSNQVEIFPTPRRNGNIDNNSRLNTEQNITELTNRLVGNQSYIVSGLDFEIIKDENQNITHIKVNEGQCIINGYLFNFSDNLIEWDNDWNNIDALYFTLSIKPTLISGIWQANQYLIGNTSFSVTVNFLSNEEEFKEIDIELSGSMPRQIYYLKTIGDINTAVLVYNLNIDADGWVDENYKTIKFLENVRDIQLIKFLTKNGVVNGNTIKELIFDELNVNTYTTLDTNNKFKGVELVGESDIIEEYSLLIAEKINNEWIKPISSQIITENPIYIDDGTIS